MFKSVSKLTVTADEPGGPQRPPGREARKCTHTSFRAKHLRLNKTLQMRLQTDLDSLVLGDCTTQLSLLQYFLSTIAHLKASLQALGLGDVPPSEKGLKTRACISRSGI